MHCPAIIRKLKGSWHKQLGNTLITHQMSRSRTNYSIDSAVQGHPQELDSSHLSLFDDLAEFSLYSWNMVLLQFQSSDPNTLHTYRKKKDFSPLSQIRSTFLEDFSGLLKTCPHYRKQDWHNWSRSGAYEWPPLKVMTARNSEEARKQFQILWSGKRRNWTNNHLYVSKS